MRMFEIRRGGSEPNYHKMGKKRYNSPHKRRRCNLSIEVLPEDILIKIISLLKGRDAIRTSILSRRWRHLWKHTSKLSLGYRNALPVAAASKINSYANYDKKLYGEEKVIIKKLVDNIDLILTSHRGTGLECLKIMFVLDEEGEHAPIDRWVSFASTSRVKKFVLFLHGDDPRKPQYYFPCHLFPSGRGCQLEVLYLSNCSLRADQNFDGFKSLTKLRLERVDATNGAVQNLLSKCLALKFLEISWCHPLDAIEIPSSLCKLKILIIQAKFDINKVECHSPSLSMLTYHHLRDNRVAPLLFKDALFLQEAKLELPQCSWAHVFDQVPRIFPYLKTLHLQVNWKEQVSSLSEKHSIFAHLKHLVLRNVPTKATIDATSLLKVAPLLEKLVVHVFGFEKASKRLGALHDFPHYHLKIVEMTGYTGSRGQVELLRFLLTNATQLKVMSINTQPFSEKNWQPLVPLSPQQLEIARKMFEKHLRHRPLEISSLTFTKTI